MPARLPPRDRGRARSLSPIHREQQMPDRSASRLMRQTLSRPGPLKKSSPANSASLPARVGPWFMNWPDNMDVVKGLSQLLSSAGRAEEARQFLDEYVRNHPGQRSAVDAFRGSIIFTTPSSPSKKQEPT